MEPTAIPASSHPKGRRGTLENPEVYEDVPGHVIPILEQEFDDFDTEARSSTRARRRRTSSSASASSRASTASARPTSR
jgi:hypothetical protein